MPTTQRVGLSTAIFLPSTFTLENRTFAGLISAEQMIASHMGAYREQHGRAAPVIVLSHDLYFDWLIEKGKPDQGGQMYGCPFRVERDWPGRMIATPVPQAKSIA